jgi:amino acid permease
MLRRERPIVFVLVVVAIVLVAIGIVYVTIAPPSLPSFLPGHVVRHAKHPYHGKKYWKRGVLAFLLSVVVLGSAWAVSKTRQRSLSHR